MQKDSSIKLVNPFPGLRPFTIDESHLFFGREGQSETIVNYLSEYRFAAVTGASGSGKSSLIYCGVIPLLYGGFISRAGSNWRTLAVRPGSSPIWNLATALTDAECSFNNSSKTPEIEEYYYSLLNRHTLGLADAIKQAYPKDGGNLLLVIDQFEELFRYKENRETLSEHNDDPRAFIKLLVNIVKQTELPVYVVLTMRSDFIGDCSDYQDLTSLINKSNYLVPQMTRGDYERVIMGPLKVAGADIQPRLLQEILNNLESNHDQLPVLQHVLMRTWDFWIKNNTPGSPISLRDYMAAGKLDNALSLHANEAYNILDDRSKQICRTLFKAITEKGKEGKGIRRPASIKEISEIARVGVSDIIHVIEIFRESSRSFLTPSLKTSLTEETVIDISHESLMRVWDKLKLWVDEEASSAQTYIRLVELSGAYQAGRAQLIQPPDLQVAVNWKKSQNPNRTWAGRYNPAFEKAMVFLNASEKKFHQEEENKIRIQKRALHRTRRIAILLGIFAIAFFALTFYAYQQSQEAIAQKERAESYASLVEGEKNEVVQLSQQQEYQLLKEREKIDSLTKARQTQLLQNPEQEQSYQELLDEMSRRTEELEQTAQRIEEEKKKAQQFVETAIKERSKAEKISKDEMRKRMLLHSNSIAIKSSQVDDKQLSGLLAYQAFRLNRENGGQPNHPEIYRALYNSLRNLKGQKYNTLKGHTGHVNSLIFDPARNLLYSSDAKGVVNRWSFNKNNPTPRSVLENERGNTSLDITSDGRWMACGLVSGEVQIINSLLPNQQPRIIEAHSGKVIDVKFVPGKNAIVTSGADYTVKYWDLLTNEGKTIIHDKSGILDLDVASNGKTVIGITTDGKLVRWNVTNNKKQMLYKHTSTLHSVAFDYEAEKIALGSRTGDVVLINALNGKVIEILKGHNSTVLTLTFSPDNRLLATSGLDGVMRIWNVDDLNDLPIEIREHESWVEAIAFSPDSKNLLSTSNDGNFIYIWPVKAEILAINICGYLTRQLTATEWNSFIGKEVEYKTACE